MTPSSVLTNYLFVSFWVPYFMLIKYLLPPNTFQTINVNYHFF